MPDNRRGMVFVALATLVVATALGFYLVHQRQLDVKALRRGAGDTTLSSDYDNAVSAASATAPLRRATGKGLGLKVADVEGTFKGTGHEFEFDRAQQSNGEERWIPAAHDPACRIVLIGPAEDLTSVHATVDHGVDAITFNLGLWQMKRLAGTFGQDASSWVNNRMIALVANQPMSYADTTMRGYQFTIEKKQQLFTLTVAQTGKSL